MNVESLVKSRIQIQELISSHNEKLLNLEETIEFVNVAKQLGKKVIMIQGTWDLTHAGHIQHIDAASEYGDLVLMSIASREYAKRVKGKGRPIEKNRKSVVSSFEKVDAVYVEEEVILPDDIDGHAQILSRINPNMLALEIEDEHFEVKKMAVEKANQEYGAEIQLIILRDLEHIESTTGIIQHILDHYCQK